MRNPGKTPIVLPAHEPFVAFSVLATAGGKPLIVHQPALDIGVNPITIVLPPGGVVTLHSPIRLRIAAGAEPGTDRFVWTIAQRPEDVTLHVRLGLPPPFDGPFPLPFA